MPAIDISIIIPAYNRLNTLPQTIASCRINKCHVEIIVIDDGSTDGTPDWLQQQQNLVVISQPNMGKCWAVNKGFKIARGKYVRFLDSDDLVDQGANDEQFLLAEHDNADLVTSGYRTFNSDGATVKIQPYSLTDDFIAQQLGEGDGSHYSAFLFKRSFIADIPHRPDFAFRDDRLFVLEAALKEPVMAIHNGTALVHRVGTQDRLQNTSGLKQQVQNYQQLNLYKIILNRLAAANQLTKRRIAAAINVLWPLAHWMAKDTLPDAQSLFSYIRELDPHFKVPKTGIAGKLFDTIGFYNTERILNISRSFLHLFK